MLLTERDAALQRLQNYEMQIQQQRLLQQQTLAAGQIPQQFDPNFMARLQPNMFPPQQIPIEVSLQEFLNIYFCF
jgi:hypothetical protein